MSTNVLVATSQVKFLTGITTTENDLLIETFVPMILDDIVNYTKNYFVNSTMYYHDDQFSFSTSSGVNTVFYSDTEENFSEFLTSTTRIYITGSKFNDGYWSLSEVGSSYILINESIKTESSSTGKRMTIFRVEYPRDLEMIAARMIKYIITTQDNPDLKSESLGDYSYSRFDLIGGNMYPKGTAAGLNKYRKMRAW